MKRHRSVLQKDLEYWQIDELILEPCCALKYYPGRKKITSSSTRARSSSSCCRDWALREGAEGRARGEGEREPEAGWWELWQLKVTLLWASISTHFQAAWPKYPYNFWLCRVRQRLFAAWPTWPQDWEGEEHTLEPDGVPRDFKNGSGVSHIHLKVLKSAKSFPTLTLMGFSEQILGPRGTLIEPLIPVRPSFHPSAPISPEFIDELKHWHCRQASWTPQIVHFWKPKMSVSKFGENSNTETTELCMMLYVFGKVVTIGV